MKRTFKFILRLVVGLLVLSLLLYKLDFSKVYNTIIEVNLYIILLIFLYTFITIFLSSLNIVILLHALNSKISLYKIFKNSLLAWSFGKYLPGRIGEFSLVYFLNKEGVSYGEGSSISVLDKLITFIVLFAIGAFGFFIFFSFSTALKLTLGFIGLIIIFCFLLFSSKIRFLIRKYILRSYSEKFKGFSKNLLYLIRRKKRILLLNLIFTFIKSTFGALIVLLIFYYFKIPAPFFMVLIINSLGVLVALIPISIGGLGVKEVSLVYLYSQIGIDPVTTGSIYILIRFIGFLVAGISLIGFNGGLKWQKN